MSEAEMEAQPRRFAQNKDATRRGPGNPNDVDTGTSQCVRKELKP